MLVRLLCALLFASASVFFGGKGEAELPPAGSDKAEAALSGDLNFLTPLLANETRLVNAVLLLDHHELTLADIELSEAHRLRNAAEAAALPGNSALEGAFGLKTGADAVTAPPIPQEAPEPNPHASALEQKARARLDWVRSAYEAAIKRYPNNAVALTYHGELLYDRFGDEEKGVELWHEAVAADPHFAVPYTDLALHHSHVGEYAACFENLDKAIELGSNDADVLYSAVQLYLIHFPQAQKHYGWTKEEIFRKSMAWSEKAARLRPDNYRMQYDYAFNFFAGQRMDVAVDWQAAAEAWQRARAQAEYSLEVFNSWINEARAWLRQPDKAKAIACLEEALKINPSSPAARALLETARNSEV